MLDRIKRHGVKSVPANVWPNDGSKAVVTAARGSGERTGVFGACLTLQHRLLRQIYRHLKAKSRS